MTQSAADPAPRVLIVDDDRTQADMLRNMLELEGFDAVVAYTPADGIDAARRTMPHVVVSDYNMPQMNGVEMWERLRPIHPGLVFIVITAFGTLETAVDAMKRGVHDFVTKPVDVGELVIRINKALRIVALEVENRDLKGAVEALRRKVHVVGDSMAMQQVLETVSQVSQSPATVLIQGESGTGKELVARAIHVQSPRHGSAYVQVNCAAIPENLLESELFGHTKGAFTGAVSDRKGKFEIANGGTLLLDEIGDLPLSLQPKLLRVLQERTIEPLGSSTVVRVDIRLIAATHRDLEAMVDAGEFREDLYYRLKVIPISLPPLRERPDDVLPLAQHFLRIYCEENLRRITGFTRSAEERLRTWPWPGNVRELENCVERAVVLASEEVIDEPDLMLTPMRREDDAGREALLDALFDSSLTLERLERDVILAALERCGGNLSRTARTLGLTRRALQYRVEKIRNQADGSESGG